MKNLLPVAACAFLCAFVISVCLINGATITNNDRLRYNMSGADIEVHDVDDFTILQRPDGSHEIWVDNTDYAVAYMGGASMLVETDLDEQAAAELFYTKEEIQIRVSGRRVSIISGDNGQF